MNPLRLLAALACAFALLGVAAANAGVGIEVVNLFPNSVDRKIPVPAESTNPYFDVSYGGVVFTMDRFRNRDRWLVSVEVVTDEHYAHHSVGYVTDFGSYTNGPNGIFGNVKDGDFVADTLGASAFSGIWGTQGGFNGVNFLEADVDNSTANGHLYGIPFGAQTNAELLVVQVHLHNPESIPDLRVPFKVIIKTSTIPPRYDIGLIFNGAIGVQSVLPINEDGTAIFEGRTDPAYFSCMTPGAQPCDNCCPYGSHVVSKEDQPFQGLMQFLDIPEAQIIGGFVHAHGTQQLVEFGIVPFEGGADEMIYECEGCGHNHMTGEQKSAWQWFDQPIPVRAGDGFIARCTYKRHMGSTEPIVFGFKTEQEMCNGFFYIAHERTARKKPAFIPDLGRCASLINPGKTVGNSTWISDPVDREKYNCDQPTCVLDPICNPMEQNLPFVA